MTDWERDRQDWIAEGRIVARLVCAACGGNKAVAEIRCAYEDGALLVRQLPTRRAADAAAADQRGETRRAPLLSQMVDELDTWDRTFRCRRHGKRSVAVGDLEQALADVTTESTIRG